MKKILFAMAALFGCITTGFAQVTFISTLQHEGNLSYYYGIDAFSTAYNAAVTGDTITLSGGHFTFSGGFDKGITVRGNGTTSDLPSVIRSQMDIYSNDANHSATFEGIRFNSVVNISNTLSEQGQGKINFIKCLFDADVTATNGNSYSTEKGPVTRFTNCVLTHRMYFNDNSYPYFTFANCYVFQPHCGSGVKSNYTIFENCVINYRSNVSGTSDWYYSNTMYAYYLSFYNSIFIFDDRPQSGSEIFPSTAVVRNCLSVNSSSCFNNIYYDGTNNTVGSVTSVFKTYQSGYDSSDNYALTDEAAATYLGTDGTQIGVNGGHTPFTQTVQYPIVTTLKANQTSKEGMLSVEVGIDE